MKWGAVWVCLGWSVIGCELPSKRLGVLSEQDASVTGNETADVSTVTTVGSFGTGVVQETTDDTATAGSQTTGSGVTDDADEGQEVTTGTPVSTSGVTGDTASTGSDHESPMWLCRSRCTQALVCGGIEGEAEMATCGLECLYWADYLDSECTLALVQYYECIDTEVCNDGSSCTAEASAVDESCSRDSCLGAGEAVGGDLSDGSGGYPQTCQHSSECGGHHYEVNCEGGQCACFFLGQEIRQCDWSGSCVLEDDSDSALFDAFDETCCQWPLDPIGLPR